MGPLPRKKMRLFIYVRVSTEREKMCSPKIQIKSCDRYAEKYDAEIVEIVPDLDKTGRDFADRKIADLIQRVKNGEADGILIYRINRWGREAEQCMAYLKQLMAVGGFLLSTKETIDMTTSGGRKAIRDAFSDAEYESDVIGDNWRAAHEDRWDAGLRHSGREIFGYRRCDDCRRRKDKERAYEYCETCEGVLVPDDRKIPLLTNGEVTGYADITRAEALVEFYKRFVAGEATQAIVIDLSRRGVRSLNDAVMDAQSWYRVADTGFAAGYVRRKSEKMRGIAKSHKPEDYDIWLKGQHAALIDEELWLAYKKRRAGRTKQNHYNKRSRFASGLLRCQRVRHDTGKPCNGSMVSYTANGKTVNGRRIPELYFRCSKFVSSRQCAGLAVSAEFVERAVLVWIEENAVGSEAMDEKIKAAAKRTQSKLNEVADLERKLTVLRDRKERLKLLWEDPDSGITDDDYRDSMKRLNASIEEREADLERAREAASVGGPPPPEVFQGLRAEWGRISEDRKRQMLSRVIDRIEVRPRARGERHSRVEIFAVWDAA